MTVSEQYDLENKITELEQQNKELEDIEYKAEEYRKYLEDKIKQLKEELEMRTVSGTNSVFEANQKLSKENTYLKQTLEKIEALPSYTRNSQVFVDKEELKEILKENKE